MKETDLTRQFINELKKQSPTIWAFKVHGDPMQKRGVPDNILCCHGKFLAIEFKIDRGKIDVSPLQQYEMEKIFKAGGVAVVVSRREKDGKICFVNKEYNDIKTAAERFYWDLVVNI